LVNFNACANVYLPIENIWLEYWKFLNKSANFIIKYVHFILDIDYQISYNLIKHMSGGCGCGIVGALYGKVIITFATASQGGFF